MNLLAFNNFVHILAGVVWIGGMIYTNFILMPSLTSIDSAQRGMMLGAIAKRFTIVSWVSIAMLLITGIYRTPSQLFFNTSHGYAVMLTVKQVLFILMILSGAVITFVFAPRLRTFIPKPGEKPSEEFLNAQKNLKMFSVSNMMMGIIILIAVSMY